MNNFFQIKLEILKKFTVNNFLNLKQSVAWTKLKWAYQWDLNNLNIWMLWFYFSIKKNKFK